MRHALSMLALLCLGTICGAAPEMLQSRSVQEQEALVTPSESLVRTVTAPAFGDGQCPVLELEQRLSVPGAGGCNWVLSVQLNGRVLSEAVTRPRLLNKPATFDLTGTDLSFTWYSRTYRAWMSMFSSDYEHPLAAGQES